MNNMTKPTPTQSPIKYSPTEDGGVLLDVSVGDFCKALLELTPDGSSSIWISFVVSRQARENLRAILLPLAKRWLNERDALAGPTIGAMSSLWDDTEVISSYTRSQAIDDGVLVPTTSLVSDEDMASDAGFKWPVALTTNVAILVEASTKEMASGQSTKGRLWDVLNLLQLCIASSHYPEERLRFKVRLHMDRDGYRARDLDVEMWAAVDTTDGYPALTIMLPEDD